MLLHLDIRDIALIDRAELRLRPGLNVLTGETGAGKSILLDALGFALGWRGRADMVRSGADAGEVTAVFSLGPAHPARALLAEAGLPVADELVLRRLAAADGRKTAFVNDRRASGDTLRALSDTLVELHGQQGDRGLLDPRGHRQILDAFAGNGALLAQAHSAWTVLGKARRVLGETRARLAAAEAEGDFLRHAVAEFDRLDPQPGEDGKLDTERRAMQRAARIGEDVARAHQALGPEGAEGAMLDALRRLEAASAHAGDVLDAGLTAIGSALERLGEAEREVASVLDHLRFDPAVLERVEERLFAIRALARKHSVHADDLPQARMDLRRRLDELEHGADDVAAREADLAAAEAVWRAVTEALSGARRAAAARLDAAMAHELAPLRLERAVFSTQIVSGEAGPDGVDDVTFTVATNPGAPAGPLNRIASGGELSRFLLALKVCLSTRSDELTLIFDEIDRGVGGATADAVGRRLEALAQGGQVLVVTHSPQVAARAAHHWRVEKRVEAGTTRIFVHELGAAERVDEIGRMLAGDTITDAARAAARELIGAAG